MPLHKDQRGHPVGIHSRFRNDLLTLEGDAGARAIIAENKSEVRLIETDDPGVLVDVDTVADYQNLTR
jgi:molybdenum cofactor cytidylyltransferase